MYNTNQFVTCLSRKTEPHQKIVGWVKLYYKLSNSVVIRQVSGISSITDRQWQDSRQHGPDSWRAGPAFCLPHTLSLRPPHKLGLLITHH